MPAHFKSDFSRRNAKWRHLCGACRRHRRCQLRERRVRCLAVLWAAFRRPTRALSHFDARFVRDARGQLFAPLARPMTINSSCISKTHYTLRYARSLFLGYLRDEIRAIRKQFHELPRCGPAHFSPPGARVNRGTPALQGNEDMAKLATRCPGESRKELSSLEIISSEAGSGASDTTSRS
jgi:hypothetical protein